MSAAPPPERAAAFTHRETIVIIAGLMLGMFLAALNQTIVATALPHIAADLHGVDRLSWVVSAYLLTATAATPIYGKLSDLYGRKILLQAAIGIFLATSALCAAAAGMDQLVAFRALQGIGGGGLIAMAHATIADIISPRERGRYQAYIASSFVVASVLGPVLGGWFAEHLTWRWVFWINLPIGIGALAVSQATLKRLVPKRVRHRIDYPGALLIVAAVCCVLLVTTMGGREAAWNSPLIEGLSAAALVFLALAVVQERRASEPVLPPRLFANKVFVLVNSINALTSVGLLGGIVFLPVMLQLVYGMTAGDAGWMLIPMTASQVVAAICTGRLMAATGRYKIFPLIGAVLNLAGMLLLATLTPATPMPLVAGTIMLSGIGIGLTFPVLIVAVQNAVHGRDLGTATSSISFFRSLGGSFGVALFGAVLMARLDARVGAVPGADILGGSPGIQLLRAGADAQSLVPAAIRGAVADAIAASFHDVFQVGAGVALLVLLCVLLLEEVPLRTTPGMAAEGEARPPRGGEAAGPAD